MSFRSRFSSSIDRNLGSCVVGRTLLRDECFCVGEVASDLRENYYARYGSGRIMGSGGLLGRGRI